MTYPLEQILEQLDAAAYLAELDAPPELASRIRREVDKLIDLLVEADA